MHAYSIHPLALLLHVAAAAVLVGGSLFAGFNRSAIRDADSLASLRRTLAFAERTGRVSPVAALLLLASGIYLGQDGLWRAPWFAFAAAAWVLDLLLAVLVVERSIKSVGKAIETADGPVPPGVDALRWATQWDVAAHFLLASDLALLYVMLYRPSLAGCFGALASAAGVVLAAGAAWRWRSRPSGDATAVAR